MMTKQQRAQRAQELLNDTVVKEALAEMERRAIDEFVAADKWWSGDKRRRLAAEHIRQVRDFRHRLEMAIVTGSPERIRSIA